MMGPLLWVQSAVAGGLIDIDVPLQVQGATPADAAVIVANQDYLHLHDVPFAHRDGTAMEGFLQYTRGIPKGQISLVVDATRDEMEAALKEAAGSVAPGGTLWVYFSGQGTVDPTANTRVLLGTDAPPHPQKALSRGFSIPDIEGMAHRPTHQTLLVLDVSYRGIGKDGAEVFPGRHRNDVPEVEAFRQQNMMVWSAASPGQEALTLPNVEHGLFTYLCIGAMRGWADGTGGAEPDGTITLEEAATYVRERAGVLSQSKMVPTLERGGAARSWELSQAALEEPPNWGAMHDAPPDLNLKAIPAAKPDPQAAKKRREAIESVERKADKRWKKIAPVVAKGGVKAIALLEDFIEDFDGAVAKVDGQEMVVVLEQVEQAKTLLVRLQARSP